jgi:hypothetical protein
MVDRSGKYMVAPAAERITQAGQNRREKQGQSGAQRPLSIFPAM